VTETVIDSGEVTTAVEPAAVSHNPLRSTKRAGDSRIRSQAPPPASSIAMIKQTLRDAAYATAPRFVIDEYLRLKMIRQARRLCELRDSGFGSAAMFELLRRSDVFRPLQKKSEILRLVGLLRSLQPSAICEIGAAGGGTTFLLAQAASNNATIVTVDLGFTQSCQAAVSLFGSKAQKIICLRENSHQPETVDVVRNRLEGKDLDLLYVDGDHGYEGVKTDFELYSPLVKRGGIIVFHDIVPDYKTRFGIKTSSDVGGVPQFWQEIKSRYADVEEIVEDYDQDGFGIGISALERSRTLTKFGKCPCDVRKNTSSLTLGSVPT
jgi:predicted O-methyltransferase YrrM